MEKMTTELLEQVARGALATRGELLPPEREANDGLGLFEASQGGSSFKQAQSTARLMKKSGTKAKDAKDRLQARYGLKDFELRALLTSVWGKAATEEIEGLAEAT